MLSLKYLRPDPFQEMCNVQCSEKDSGKKLSLQAPEIPKNWVSEAFSASPEKILAQSQILWDNYPRYCMRFVPSSADGLDHISP